MKFTLVTLLLSTQQLTYSESLRTTDGRVSRFYNNRSMNAFQRMMMISKVRKSYLPGYEAYLENKYGVGRVGLSKRGNSGPIHRSSVNVGLPASYGMRFLHVSEPNNSAWKKSRKLKQGSEYRYKDNILKSNKMSTFIPEKEVSMSTLPFMPFHKRGANRDSRSYRHHRKHLHKRNFLKHGFENFMNSLSRELKSFRESKKTMGKRSSLPLYDYLYDMAYNSQGKNHDWAGKELDQEMDGKEQDDKEQRETKGEEDKETTPSSKLNFREYYAPILDDQIASLDSWLNQASENENYDYRKVDDIWSNHLSPLPSPCRARCLPSPCGVRCLPFLCGVRFFLSPCGVRLVPNIIYLPVLRRRFSLFQSSRSNFHSQRS